jgi:hypothetical protein
VSQQVRCAGKCSHDSLFTTASCNDVIKGHTVSQQVRCESYFLLCIDLQQEYDYQKAEFPPQPALLRISHECVHKCNNHCTVVITL